MDPPSCAITTTIFPGKYIQGPGALSRVRGLVDGFGGRALVVAGPRVQEAVVVPRLAPTLDATRTVYEQFRGETTRQEIARLAEVAASARCTVVVGVGGGKVADAAKAAAAAHDHARLPVVVCPTIASTDAPCSALSVVYTDAGAVEAVLELRANPDAVVVDTAVVVQAPVRFLVAGMGDALATHFEAESCRTRAAPNCASKTDMGSTTAYALAALCWAQLREYGALAVVANTAHALVPAFERIVEANTLLSGLGFESAGLATAHAVHDGLTLLPATRTFLHGEKVAVGTLCSLFLTDKAPDVIDQVFAFCEAVGLPTTLAQIGLAGATREDLMLAAQRACQPGTRIHWEPHRITPEAVLNALLMADAYGKSRKCAH
jgi:glycerol dehydrogenase